MQQLTEKAEKLISEYSDALAEKGIVCSVSKKYFETKASTVSHHYSYTLLDDIHRYFAHKRENKYFKHQRNRHHCAVLCFHPADRTLLKKSECKEYSFMLSEVSRSEEGMAPKERIHKEKTVLKKIEKRICKILKSAEKKDPVRVCKCTKGDFIKYFFRKEYGYMKSINGKDRDFLDLVISAVFLGTLGIIALISVIL